MLSAKEYIISKQVQWALNRGIELIGSKGKRGRKTYTPELEQNLFMPLFEEVRASFSQGNGNEVVGEPDSPAKMQAVHSSSALCVNVFQYWESIHQVPVIASACGFCNEGKCNSENIRFEEKNFVKGIRGAPPNIDVVIKNSKNSPFECFAIESKFAEPYQGTKVGIALAYLKQEYLWGDIPELHQFAKAICPENDINHYFDTAQIIRHILGLKSSYSKNGFKLLYLWYDVLGREGADHRDEINAFAKIALSDGIHFSSLTYQELIIVLAKSYRHEHPEYIKYLTERYL